MIIPPRTYLRLAQIGIEPQKEFSAIVAKYGGFMERGHRQLLFDKIRLADVRQPQPASLG